MFDFDLFVIGAGSGGVRAARTAAALGARVAIVDDKPLGGTCVNVGCVPKKLYSYAGHYSADFADSAGFGWLLGDVKFDWATLRDNKKKEIARLNGIYRSLLEKAGVTVIAGRASLTDGHTVEVGDSTYRARYILLSTGGRPQLPDFPGRELAISSDQIFDLAKFPERLLVVGAGYIGVEFAGIFAGLGASVTHCWRGDLPLRGFDEDLRKRYLREAGKHCTALPATKVQQVELAGGCLRVTLNDGKQLEVDQLLAATGRVANTESLGLENTNVRLDANGYIAVSESLQTTEPSIYALGDVVGRMPLTPVALAEAMWVADHLFGSKSRQLSYHGVPTAVFSHPNLATVGLTEAQARERFGEVAVFETDFRHLKHTLSGRDERTYMKVLVDTDSDQVLGMHMMGNEAGEIIQGFATAMVCGLTKRQLDATIGIHPTAAEEFVTLRTRSR